MLQFFFLRIMLHKLKAIEGFGTKNKYKIYKWYNLHIGVIPITGFIGKHKYISSFNFRISKRKLIYTHGY